MARSKTATGAQNPGDNTKLAGNIPNAWPKSVQSSTTGSAHIRVTCATSSQVSGKPANQLATASHANRMIVKTCRPNMYRPSSFRFRAFNLKLPRYTVDKKPTAPLIVGFRRAGKVGNPKAPYGKKRNQEKKENAVAEYRLAEAHDQFPCIIFDLVRIYARSLFNDTTDIPVASE
ncbi:MAG TPA: hypothetical protein VFG52_08950 [Xanthomonadales bacterium]|nr:hypothetical protein [Xanthomonadales bacterium]